MPGFDTGPEEGGRGRSRLRHRVTSDDIRGDQPDPTAAGPASDPHPELEDDPPAGRPLTDAEVEALPVEEAGP